MFDSKHIKKWIERNGSPRLVFWNSYGENFVLTHIDSMFVRKGNLVLKWKLPRAAHTSPFDAAAIQGGADVFWTDKITPLRLDNGTREFRLELDYA